MTKKNKLGLPDYHVEFLEYWRDKMMQDKNSGWHRFADKGVVIHFHEIATKYFPRLEWPVPGCIGCDEVIDMIHYVYEEYDALSNEPTKS